MPELTYKLVIRSVFILGVLTVLLRGLFTYGSTEYTISSSTAPFLVGAYLLYLIFSHFSETPTGVKSKP